ncbi:ATP-dependent DNA helicase PIF1 [Acrodontium crateriforme]|uniref:ATP-dependent DNA helicase PIF1 n=1 Tax=Acrodontium crateriforme TaxID=150365 RepID=A0AAQ3M7G8_9PEZI|nr:ATP-dependent DNA helicase PIF1 [Acrodontium crateriforme]
MFHSAVNKHNQQAAKQRSLQDLFSSSPPVPEKKPVNSSVVNPGYRNPLKPATSSSLNAVRNPNPKNFFGGLGNATKRTASGLAKATDGTFDDGLGSQNSLTNDKPRSLGKSGIIGTKMAPVEIIDEFDDDDFPDDIELDIELPKVATSVKPPQYQNRASAPPKSIAYPTLPRLQEAQVGSTRAVTEPAGDLNHVSIRPPPVAVTPQSSQPLPWSSSPPDHHQPAAQKMNLKSYAYTQSDIAPPRPVKRTSDESLAQPKPKSRRKIPWENESIEEEVKSQSAPVQSTTPSTPMVKEGKTSFLWNTTATIVKEQQKKHREESRKAAVKINEGTENDLRKAKSARTRPARVFLSEEQQHVLELVTEQKKSVFFTGSAGTGKSVLMREVIASLRKKYQREPDRVACTASTGLAACNIGGVTLHSFAGIGLGKEEVPELVRKIKRNQKAKHRWMRTKVLIIDEVSMVDGELFDKLEAIARQMRNNGRPFGGIQLVITGDFFQLPPVPDSGRVAKFAFDASTWSTAIDYTIGLTHVFRQKDPIFAGMLNEMREGRLSESSIKAFRSLSRELTFQDAIESTELFPTRNEVERANTSRLGMLQGEVQIFEARDGGSIVEKTHRDKLLSNCMAPEIITLKKGAQVMLIKNVDETLVNGSLGKVLGFMSEQDFDRYDQSDNVDAMLPTQRDVGEGFEEKAKARVIQGITTARKYPVVRFKIADGTSRDLLCQPETWKVELPNGEVQASRAQVPLILAWALSIHKAQGQTLDRVKVDLGKVFEKGQAYVALSRATSMAGLQVLRFDPKKVNAHEKVRSFYANLTSVELAEKTQDQSKRGGKKPSFSADEYEKRFMEGGV